ncbi:LruC domain-containing protein [Shewanella marina]|uniref:LruC domain-containing protein n=1 Tax=Shewanella marina TaxID=487319 RepID=UPI000AE9D5C5|nr:LruC domain-containing protein [Shewanella marina]
MNDVIMNLRIAEFVKDGSVRRVSIEAKLAAMGAYYQNGFGIQLQGVPSDQIKSDSISWSLDSITQTDAVQEDNQTNAVFILSNDVSSQVTLLQGCSYLRTEQGCDSNYRTTWQLSFAFENPIAQADMPAPPYDPFIFATPYTKHGTAAKNVVGEHPGRQLEIHLKNQAPTDAFNTAYFGAREDASDPGNNQYFMNNNGMSWAIEIPSSWKHPKELKRLDNAYPQFVNFAADATGNTNNNWYETSVTELIFDN